MREGCLAVCWAGDSGAMEAALRKLCADVEAAVQGGCEVLVLSDRVGKGEEVRHVHRALLFVLIG